MRGNSPSFGVQRSLGAILALLIAAAVGLPRSQAQIEYNGGLVQTHHADHGEIQARATPTHTLSSPWPNVPPSFFPDNDFQYPVYVPTTASPARSYYHVATEDSRKPSRDVR